MNILSQETLSQFIDLRFYNKVNPGKDLPVDKHFYKQLVRVFQNPHKFERADFSCTSIPTILHYLRKTHEFYISSRIGEIQLAIEQLKNDIEGQQDWCEFLANYFDLFCEKLRVHIDQEEKYLFPYIEALINTQQEGIIHFCFSQKIHLINHLLHHDHAVEEDLGELIGLLEERSVHLTDSVVLSMLISRMKVFHLDLTIHARIEDEVLMPKALSLEQLILSDPNLNFS